MSTTAPAGVVSSSELGHAPRWYCLSADGMATLCVDEEDAKKVAAESWVLYPQNAPYRAAQMVDASAVAAAAAAERELCAKLCDTLAKDCTGINARLAYRYAAGAIRGKQPNHQIGGGTSAAS